VRKLPEVSYILKKHPFVQVDQKKRFLVCPRCGNKNFSDDANYCKMCGLYLYNSCTRTEVESDSPSECGMINPGDARYCEYCGSPTRLLELGLLMTWEELIESQKEVAAGLDPSLQKESDNFLEDDFPDLDDFPEGDDLSDSLNDNFPF
jgi:ribosomal protein L37E